MELIRLGGRLTRPSPLKPTSAVRSRLGKTAIGSGSAFRPAASIRRCAGWRRPVARPDACTVANATDHGNHNGDRGLRTKMTLYNESAGIPMIVAGPGGPVGETVATLTSLVDVGPTVLSAFGIAGGSSGAPGPAAIPAHGSIAHPSRGCVRICSPRERRQVTRNRNWSRSAPPCSSTSWSG